VFPPHAIAFISQFFYHVDQMVRMDLINGRVVNERDYMSRYITLLQYPYGILPALFFPYSGLYFVNTLPGPYEQASLFSDLVNVSKLHVSNLST
jgi:hypothetical protein